MKSHIGLIYGGPCFLHRTFTPCSTWMQIVGAEHLREGHKKDGYVARWMGIYDDKGRVMVAADLKLGYG